MYFSPCCYLTWHTLYRFCDAEAWYEITHRQQNISQVTFTRFIGGGNRDWSEKFCLSVRVKTPVLLLILWSKGGWTEHDSVLPLFISSLIVFWFDKLMCRSLAFPSYEGSVWHDMDKRPSSCWVSFLRGAEASHAQELCLDLLSTGCRIQIWIWNGAEAASL